MTTAETTSSLTSEKLIADTLDNLAAYRQGIEDGHRDTVRALTEELTETLAITEDGMLYLLKDPEFAIGFALEHLQPWELQAFFQDWKNGEDMEGWLIEWQEKQGRAHIAGIRADAIPTA